MLEQLPLKHNSSFSVALLWSEAHVYNHWQTVCRKSLCCLPAKRISQSKTAPHEPFFYKRRHFFFFFRFPPSRKRKVFPRESPAVKARRDYKCVHVQTYGKRGRKTQRRGRKKWSITEWFVGWQYTLTFLLPRAKRKKKGFKHSPSLLLSLPGLGIWHHSGENKSPVSLVGAGSQPQ